ncbi:MAG: hypothetical protein Tp118SUR00d2C21406231_19 [Prokaryotic dsDNA virus sp.]|nr:MAG: hypothetical protein Tp125DCM00d2C40298531_38 [Prokaryotic dsDNA virus sp.]QDP53139.1 MAG: hypothetical protein Tp118SUR00d2C21406231_19 [Prokaryotic dsDNA virus sp.]|tara:strand:+ start:16177 stop:16491 length:315 start_codon:yes stop_codon:yes gene_type:complete
MIFSPDDFAGRPYEGGLNQTGHMVAGAALSAFLPIPVALAGILAWEVWQFKRRGATMADMRIDAVYWIVGAVTWPLNIWWWPALPVAAFVLEYVRISRGSHAED